MTNKDYWKLFWMFNKPIIKVTLTFIPIFLLLSIADIMFLYGLPLILVVIGLGLWHMWLKEHKPIIDEEYKMFMLKKKYLYFVNKFNYYD